MAVAVGKLKVAELRSQLAARNLPTTGLKPELARRLQEAIDQENSLEPQSPPPSLKRQRSTSTLQDHHPDSRPAKISNRSPPKSTSVLHHPSSPTKKHLQEPLAPDPPQSQPAEISPDQLPSSLQNHSPEQIIQSLDEKTSGDSHSLPTKNDVSSSVQIAPELPASPTSSAVQKPPSQPSPEPKSGFLDRLSSLEAATLSENQVAEPTTPEPVPIEATTVSDEINGMDKGPKENTDVSCSKIQDSLVEHPGNPRTASPTGPSTSSQAPEPMPGKDFSTQISTDADRSQADCQGNSNENPLVASVSASQIVHDSPVDPDRPPLTESLYISNLVRPLTIPQIKRKLSEFGEFSSFWIDSVRSHVYVTFNEQSACKSACESLHQTTPWPPETGKLLSCVYVPTSQVAKFITEEEENSNFGSLRGRLELTFDKGGDGEWKFELRSLSNGGNLTGSNSRPRGLASSIPSGLPQTTTPNTLINRAELSFTSGYVPTPPLSKTPSNHPLTIGMTKQIDFLKPDNNPEGGPEKWFNKTKAKPHLFWRPSKTSHSKSK